MQKNGMAKSVIPTWEMKFSEITYEKSDDRGRQTQKSLWSKIPENIISLIPLLLLGFLSESCRIKI